MSNSICLLFQQDIQIVLARFLFVGEPRENDSCAIHLILCISVCISPLSSACGRMVCFGLLSIDGHVLTYLYIHRHNHKFAAGWSLKSHLPNKIFEVVFIERISKKNY